MMRRVRLHELLALSGGITANASGTIQIMHTEPEMCPDSDYDVTQQMAAMEQKTAAVEQKTTTPNQKTAAVEQKTTTPNQKTAPVAEKTESAPNAAALA